MIDALLDTMAATEAAFHAGLSSLAFRGQGVKPPSQKKGTDTPVAWYGMVALRARDPAQAYTTPATIVGRDLGHLITASSHQKLSQKAMEMAMEPHLLACAELLRRAVPVLGANTGFLQLSIPVDHEGTLGKPLWRVASHGLHGLAPTGPNRKPLAALFKDLAQEPEPTGIYRIGNKTYAAADPRSAIAQHIRFLAPKTPKHKRKAPAHLPEVKRVWDSREAKVMAEEVMASWKA